MRSSSTIRRPIWTLRRSAAARLAFCSSENSHNPLCRRRNRKLPASPASLPDRQLPAEWGSQADDDSVATHRQPHDGVVWLDRRTRNNRHRAGVAALEVVRLSATDRFPQGWCGSATDLHVWSDRLCALRPRRAYSMVTVTQSRSQLPNCQDDE